MESRHLQRRPLFGDSKESPKSDGDVLFHAKAVTGRNLDLTSRRFLWKTVYSTHPKVLQIRKFRKPGNYQKTTQVDGWAVIN